jgi:hypothetical protein
MLSSLSEAQKASYLLVARGREFVLAALKYLRPTYGGEATRRTWFLVGKIIFLLPKARKKF